MPRRGWRTRFFGWAGVARPGRGWPWPGRKTWLGYRHGGPRPDRAQRRSRTPRGARWREYRASAPGWAVLRAVLREALAEVGPLEACDLKAASRVTPRA